MKKVDRSSQSVNYFYRKSESASRRKIKSVNRPRKINSLQIGHNQQIENKINKNVDSEIKNILKRIKHLQQDPILYNFKEQDQDNQQNRTFDFGQTNIDKIRKNHMYHPYTLNLLQRPSYETNFQQNNSMTTQNMQTIEKETLTIELDPNKKQQNNQEKSQKQKLKEQYYHLKNWKMHIPLKQINYSKIQSLDRTPNTITLQPEHKNTLDTQYNLKNKIKKVQYTTRSEISRTPKVVQLKSLMQKLDMKKQFEDIHGMIKDIKKLQNRRFDRKVRFSSYDPE